MRRAVLFLFVSLVLLPPVSAQFFVKEQIRLLPFVEDGNWGFIDERGNKVIEPRFKSVTTFSEGYAAVQLHDGRMTFIDRDGEFTFEPRAIQLDPISEGLASARSEGKWGYINSAGKVVIPFKFDFASDFFEGVARIQVLRKFAFIDRKGTLITRLYKRAYNFSEGLAIVEIRGKRGYIDQFDEIVIKPAFDDSEGFSQGLAAVRIGGKYGFINKRGEYAIKPAFESASWFSNNLAPVEVRGKWGFIDRDGKFIIKPIFEEVGNFYEDRAPVRIGSKWGYIDKAGRVVIPPRFSRAGKFSLGFANVEECLTPLSRDEKEVCNEAIVTSQGELIWKSGSN